MAFFYCGINCNICVHTPSKEVIQCEKQQSLQLCSAFWFACWQGITQPFGEGSSIRQKRRHMPFWKKKSGLSDEVYVLGEDDGFLAVFYEDGKKQLRLKERTELPLSALPDGEARQLQEGMRVIGEENLAKVLADFMS